MATLARTPNGRFAPHPDALARFLSYCRFDARTGCVVWVGGKTRGRGKTAVYGSFWYEGRSWRAHVWAARFIHGQDTEGKQVDHRCCNTVCVRHVLAVPPTLNRELQWIRVQVGLDPEPPEPDELTDDFPPYFRPPQWAIDGGVNFI